MTFQGAPGRLAASLLVVGVMVYGVALAILAAPEAEAGSGPDSGGIVAVASALADEPYGTVLYDHWYSWQLRYRLFDERVYVSWFEHPDSLARELAAFGKGPGARYLVVPSGPEAAPVLRSARQEGFKLVPVALAATESGVTLYRVMP